MKRMRCSRCGKLIPESRLQEHPKYAKVAAQVATMKDEDVTIGDTELKFSPSGVLAHFEGLFHISHQLFGASGGRIGARTQRVYCGPVQEEVIDPYQDQLEHFLGMTFE